MDSESQSRNARTLSDAAFLVTAILVLMRVAGCGPDVRENFNQDTWNIIDQNGADLQDAGTHANFYLYAEGSGLKYITDEDGNETLDPESGNITKLFIRRPDTSGITDATVMQLQTFQHVNDAWSNAIRAMAGMYRPMPPPPGPPSDE